MEQRYHALDACRAVMMFLGLVIHSALTYTQFTVMLSALPVDDPAHFPWHFVDGASSPVIDGIFFFIHCFRMPVFFILAGFFAALIIQKRGSDSYIRNRGMRIGLPFVVVWATLMPLEQWSAYLANKIAGGREGYISDHPWQGYWAEVWNITGAFWFLYYLIIFSILTYFVVKYLKHSLALKVLINMFSFIHKHAVIRILVLASLTTLLLIDSDYPWLPNDQDFVPDIPLLTIYGLCFGLGYYWFFNFSYLEKLRESILVHLAFGGVAFVGFMISNGIYFQDTENRLMFMLTNAIHCIAMWCLSLGMIGLFIRFAANGSKIWRYIADSSYFVYIIHVHVFLIVQAYVSFLDWPAVPKLILGVGMSMIIATLIYHLVARHSWISVFLNGKKYDWKTQEVVR